MQHIGLDLFSFGEKDYLICIDHWSGYPFYHLLRSLMSDAILKILTSWFNLFGWLSSIRSDGGPHFHGEFPRFCEKHGIRHELSSLQPQEQWPRRGRGHVSQEHIVQMCFLLCRSKFYAVRVAQCPLFGRIQPHPAYVWSLPMYVFAHPAFPGHSY